jgi:NAD(P)-dependent dehydrogenase (short-subunit alcohol dehydrogenase family)
MVCANGVFSQVMGQESGKIINISSSTAYWDTPEFLHYIASKAGLAAGQAECSRARSLGPEVALVVGSGGGL